MHAAPPSCDPEHCKREYPSVFKPNRQPGQIAIVDTIDVEQILLGSTGGPVVSIRRTLGVALFTDSADRPPIANCVPVKRRDYTVVTTSEPDPPGKIDAAGATVIAFNKAMWHEQNEPEAPAA
jgi:hypothetical protein